MNGSASAKRFLLTSALVAHYKAWKMSVPPSRSRRHAFIRSPRELRSRLPGCKLSTQSDRPPCARLLKPADHELPTSFPRITADLTPRRALTAGEKGISRYRFGPEPTG